MDKTAALRTRLGGFMKGVCHPNKDFALLTSAGFGWVRRDVPYPFDENGRPSPAHRHFLAETEGAT